MRSMRSRSARTRARSSTALRTTTARWPASSSATRKRSRTKLVSSATTTVLAITGAPGIASLYRLRDVRPVDRSLRDRDQSRYNPGLTSSTHVTGSFSDTETPWDAYMASCPECDSDIDVDEYDVDKGDLISCPECGTNLGVPSVSPLEFESAPEEDENDHLEDDELEDDDEEDSDEEDDDGGEEDWDE